MQQPADVQQPEQMGTSIFNVFRNLPLRYCRRSRHFWFIRFLQLFQPAPEVSVRKHEQALSNLQPTNFIFLSVSKDQGTIGIFTSTSISSHLVIAVRQRESYWKALSVEVKYPAEATWLLNDQNNRTRQTIIVYNS